MPEISIIMPCYNAEFFIAEAIESLQNQIFLNWELLIVNDGSTDSSRNIATYYEKKDTRIKVISKKNGGVSSARNYGYKYISNDSKFIIFTDADDRFEISFLKQLYDKINENYKIGAVYCDHRIINDSGVLQNKFIMPRFLPGIVGLRNVNDNIEKTHFLSIFYWTKMFEALTLIRKEAYNETEGWDEKIGNIGEGVDLFCTIALNWHILYINRELYYYRRYSNQVTNVDKGKFLKQEKIIISKWNSKIKFMNKEDATLTKLAVSTFLVNRRLHQKTSSIKHQIRYDPFKGILNLGVIFFLILAGIAVHLKYFSYKNRILQENINNHQNTNRFKRIKTY